jgi:hypothetical protein
METQNVTCSGHGEKQTTFVYHHLIDSLCSGEIIGRFGSADPENPGGDAQCLACEEPVNAYGGKWTDQTMEFADIQIPRGACYDRVRAINGR